MLLPHLRPSLKSEMGWARSTRSNQRWPKTERVAIVTGAAGGIGKAMVRGLLTAGIRVAGVDRDREPLEMLAASARQTG
jgi:NADP-dependent 3-hydroxy acid dehydrogenase YdfG